MSKTLTRSQFEKVRQLANMEWNSHQKSIDHFSVLDGEQAAKSVGWHKARQTDWELVMSYLSQLPLTEDDVKEGDRF